MVGENTEISEHRNDGIYFKGLARRLLYIQVTKKAKIGHNHVEILHMKQDF